MNWTIRSGYARTPIRYGAQSVLGYISVREVARRLRKTTQHVRYLIRTGQLPAMKLADMWLIKAEHVRETWAT